MLMFTHFEVLKKPQNYLLSIFFFFFLVKGVNILKISHKEHAINANSLEHFKGKQALRNKIF